MKHLNEATIQSFLDGELLADEASERVTKHIALCQLCADALLEAEAGQAEVNFAFAAEASAPVPSQRIWARIENEIDFLGAPDKAKVETKSFWQQWGLFFTASQFAFAGGLAAVVFASFFAIQILRQAQPKPENITAENKLDVSNAGIEEIAMATPTPEIVETGPENLIVSPSRPVKASYQPKKAVKPELRNTEAQNPKSKIENRKSLKVLPEENNYLNSIAQLSKAVEASDEFVMRPSFRVDYERNLAVMDGAISAMQKQVRSNPKDENARRILFASYRNKIELLNTVAEKSQMIASLR